MTTLREEIEESGMLTVSAALDRLGSGATSTALTEWALRQAEGDADLGAFVTLDHSHALGAARHHDRSTRRGRLHGIPLVVKDNIHVAGMPNTAATPALAGFTPRANAPAVQRLIDAGAFVIGKTNMHELAFGITGTSSAAGPTRNAWDSGCFAGGSSGGTAVAVARGGLAGLGTDTGGSVRIPAALNGVCGFRPTTGRYPCAGVTPLSSTRDTIGPIARTVADLMLLDAVLADDEMDTIVAPAKEIRLGVPREYFTEPLSPETNAAFQYALAMLAGAGVTLVDVPTGEFRRVEQHVGQVITTYEAGVELTKYLGRYVPDTTLEDLAVKISGLDVRRLFLEEVIFGAPNRVAEHEYRAALAEGPMRLRDIYWNLFSTYRLDALIFPTTPRCAGSLEENDSQIAVGSERFPTFPTMVRNTSPGSIAGLPGLTIPMTPVPGGLPVGLSLDGLPWTDRTLLGIGQKMEKILNVR